MDRDIKSLQALFRLKANGVPLSRVLFKCQEDECQVIYEVGKIPLLIPAGLIPLTFFYEKEFVYLTRKLACRSAEIKCDKY